MSHKTEQDKCYKTMDFINLKEEIRQRDVKIAQLESTIAALIHERDSAHKVLAECERQEPVYFMKRKEDPNRYFKANKESFENPRGSELKTYDYEIFYRHPIPAQKVYEVPDGWQLVPIEPTLKMIAAIGFNGDTLIASKYPNSCLEAKELYQEILSAAQPPKDEKK